MALVTPAATAALYTTLAATAVSVHGQMQQAKNARRVASNNAAVARLRAADAIARGGQAEVKRRREIHQLLGAQTAAAGASGAQVESGSVLRLADDVVALGELDVLTIRNNAQREAQGLRTQAQAFLFEGAGRSQEATFGALGSAFTGASTAFQMWKFAPGGRKPPPPPEEPPKEGT